MILLSNMERYTYILEKIDLLYDMCVLIKKVDHVTEKGKKIYVHDEREDKLINYLERYNTEIQIDNVVRDIILQEHPLSYYCNA